MADSDQHSSTRRPAQQVSADGAIPVPAPRGNQALAEIGKPTRWKPGQSGNRSGLSPYALALRDALEKQETVKRVMRVIRATRIAALDGDARAAKVYLSVVGLDTGSVERTQKAVDAAVRERLAEMMEEARRRYEAIAVTGDSAQAGAIPSDVKT